MTRGVVIALAVGVLLVGGLGFFAYKKKQAEATPQPPLYAAYGPSAQNPGGPPAGKAPIGTALQDIKNVVQGGSELALAGKKAWDDVKGLFS